MKSYVDWTKRTGCGARQEKCPTKVRTNFFERGVGAKKAIYTLSPQAVPNKPVIDAEHCRYLLHGKCGVCAKVCQAKAISYDLKPIEYVLDVGAVVVATGYDQVDARARPGLGYGRLKDVITGLELERMLSASGPTGGKVLRPSDGKVPARVAFVHCALSRDPRHGVPQCSRV